MAIPAALFKADVIAPSTLLALSCPGFLVIVLIVRPTSEKYRPMIIIYPERNLA